MKHPLVNLAPKILNPMTLGLKHVPHKLQRLTQKVNSCANEISHDQHIMLNTVNCWGIAGQNCMELAAHVVQCSMLPRFHLNACQKPLFHV